MNVILVILLIAALLTSLIVNRLQAVTIQLHKDHQALQVDRANLQVFALQAQEKRYHLMWDIRRLHEQQIFGLRMACDQMAAYIKANQPPGQRPPAASDDADWWKNGGQAPG